MSNNDDWGGSGRPSPRMTGPMPQAQRRKRPTRPPPPRAEVPGGAASRRGARHAHDPSRRPERNRLDADFIPPTGPQPQLPAGSFAAPLPSAGGGAFDGALPMTGPQPSQAPGVPEGQAAIATRIVTIDPEVERGTKIVDVSVPAVVRRAQRERERQAAGAPPTRDSDEPASPLDETVLRARLFYQRLHRMDRWTTWVLLLALIGTFLPWMHMRGIGLVSGIEGLGAASGGAAMLALLLLYWRAVKRRLAALLLFVQMLLAVGVGAVPVWILMTTRDIRISYGMAVAFLTSVAAVLFTLVRFVRVNH